MLRKTFSRAAGILMALFLFSHATKLHAQTSTDKLAKTMTDNMAYLGLTPKQHGDLLTLNKAAATGLIQAAQKAKKDTTFRGKAVVQQVTGIMKKRNTSLKAMLTPDQQKLFDAHRAERLAEMQTRVMAAQLDLTDAQLPQVYDLNLEESTAIVADMNKLQDSKGKLGKMRAAKSMKGAVKDKDKAMKGILSANQYTVYEKNREEMQAAVKEWKQ